MTIKDVILRDLTKYEDARGYLVELYRSDELGFSPEMAYMSLTLPGVVRGPHEHHKQSDCFIFAGPGDFELYLWDHSGGSLKLMVGASNPKLVIVPPGIVHGYKCVSETPAYCLNFPDKLYKGKDKAEAIDEIRWELDLNSPYKII